MIYTFNARGHVLYPTMKDAFQLTEENVFHLIQTEFEHLQKRLSQKEIAYDSLKGALVPNQDADKFETCFIFDSTRIDDTFYGGVIFDTLLPLMDKDSTYSVLCGDYIDKLGKDRESQDFLRSSLKEVLYRCTPGRYQHSSQYYLVYINRLTGSQRWRIVEVLLKHPWFTGFAELSSPSTFKSYISTILVPSFIKHKRTIIGFHPSDCDDSENVNMLHYPFEKHGFSFVSINEESYGPFLSYKIEAEFTDPEDVGFSFNALFPKFNSLEELRLTVSDDKWYKYLTDTEKESKGQLLAILGYGPHDRERFISEISEKLRSSYICRMNQNDHGDWLFNACISLPTINGNNRKTTIALKYHPKLCEISIVTVT